MKFTWIWIAMSALASLLILDNVPDDDWITLNLWGRRGSIALFFVAFGVWFCQNFH